MSNLAQKFIEANKEAFLEFCLKQAFDDGTPLTINRGNVASVAVSGPTVTKTTARKQSTGTKSRTAKPQASTATKPANSSRKEKRSASDLSDTCERIYGYLLTNSGSSAEGIGKAIGLPTKAMALPIKKLVKDGKITTVGAKRSTRYFAQTNGTSAHAN